jgi:single-stranded-DNA-specific exonuclease
MKDMEKAIERIEKAIENQERILVFGDYDVDGTTAVSLVSSYLKSFYPYVATYIPDRYDEGYGVSFKGIDFADDNEFTLIIALDCGIKSIDHVAYAKERNIEILYPKPLRFLTQKEVIALILMMNYAVAELDLNSFRL